MSSFHEDDDVFKTPAGPSKKLQNKSVSVSAEVKPTPTSKQVEQPVNVGKLDEDYSSSNESGKESDDSRKSSLSSVDSRGSLDSQGKNRRGKESLVQGVRQSARLRAKTDTKPAR